MIKEKTESNINDLSPKDKKLVLKMAEAGVQFGHLKSKKNPKMNSYIYGVRGGISLIDLSSTLKKLKEALDFMAEAKQAGQTIMLVGDFPQARKITTKIAQDCHLPYVTERWIGGTLTNFNTIHRQIKHLQDLERKRASGELGKYTKREQLAFDEEIVKLNKSLGGLKELTKLPDIVFVASIKKNSTPVKEAKKMKLSVVGISDTDSNPSLADYFIPANDEALSSLAFILEQVGERLSKVATTKAKIEKKPKEEERKRNKKAKSETSSKKKTSEVRPKIKKK